MRLCNSNFNFDGVQHVNLIGISRFIWEAMLLSCLVAIEYCTTHTKHVLDTVGQPVRASDFKK